MEQKRPPSRKTKKRRRVSIVHREEDDVDFNDVEYGVAVLLRNTYRLEYNRHENNKKITGQAFAPSSWKDLPNTINDENIETSDRVIKIRTFWISLAKQLISKHIDPEQFIRAQFNAILPQAPACNENSMANDKAFSNYEASKSRAVDEVQLALTIQNGTARKEIAYRQTGLDDPEQAWIGVLYDESLSLSGLFRYCMAASIKVTAGDKMAKKVEGVMEEYRVIAALQYVRESEVYDEVWGGLLPDGFRDEAGEIYFNMFQGN